MLNIYYEGLNRNNLSEEDQLKTFDSYEVKLFDVILNKYNFFRKIILNKSVRNTTWNIVYLPDVLKYGIEYNTGWIVLFKEINSLEELFEKYNDSNLFFPLHEENGMDYTIKTIYENNMNSQKLFFYTA